MELAEKNKPNKNTYYLVLGAKQPDFDEAVSLVFLFIKRTSNDGTLCFSLASKHYDDVDLKKQLTLFKNMYSYKIIKETSFTMDRFMNDHASPDHASPDRTSPDRASPTSAPSLELINVFDTATSRVDNSTVFIPKPKSTSILTPLGQFGPWNETDYSNTRNFFENK